MGRAARLEPDRPPASSVGAYDPDLTLKVLLEQA
jgi:hypothetical protein